MTKVFNTTRLVEQVTIKGSLATGDFEDQEILDIAYDVLLSELVPLIVTLREDYFVKTQSDSITASQSSYPIATRAEGMVLRDLKRIVGTDVYPLTRMSREDVETTATGTPESFYLEENNIILYPTPDQTLGTLLQSYFFSLPVLVPVTECGRIDTINTGTRVITGTFPATWTTSDTFDFVNGKPGYQNRGIDLSASSVSTSSITMSATLPTDLVVGDYICLAGESCFVQLPKIAQLLLVYMTVAECLDSKGDESGYARATARVEKLSGLLRAFLQERVEGRPQRFTTSLI